MRMQFDVEDETAFHARRDELGEQFAEWLTTHHVPADPNDAGLLMDWKFGYGDGHLGRWTLADVDEFLFDWCARKLSAPPEMYAEIPGSVAAFVDFLTHTGLLAPGGARPAQVREYCERRTTDFQREMADPGNFGMAKSLFAGAGGLDPDADHPPEGIEALLERMQDTPPDDLGDLLELGDPPEAPRTIGPVRLPDADERLAVIRAAEGMRQVRALADHCPPPGRQLTAKGNLRLAEARYLVEAAGTGDDPELGGRRRLRSAEELPGLTALVHTALAAGAVRKYRGRLVAVARFRDQDEVEAHEKVVRAAIEVGLTGLRSSRSTFLAPVQAAQNVVDECVAVHLAALLDAGAGGVEVGTLVDVMARLTAADPTGTIAVMLGLVPGWVQTQLERLEQLGVVAFTSSDQGCPECDEPHPVAALTAAGVPIALEIVRESGIPVLVRPDPATATAAQVADLICEIDPKEWHADAAAWHAAQADPAAAAAELVGEITAAHREAFVVLLGLGAVEDVVGEHTLPAVRGQEGGPHDGLVVHWLLDHGAVDPDTIDPVRLRSGWIDILAATLDMGGPEEALACLDRQQDTLSETLDGIWRLEHPRLADVLEAIGTHHPAKPVAKAARRALMKHRSR